MDIDALNRPIFSNLYPGISVTLILDKMTSSGKAACPRKILRFTVTTHFSGKNH